jgi:menaquinone-dependent protoporphyrinogen oxidase
MTVLVAYGSKRGGTEGLARMVEGQVEAEGLTAEVRPAREVGDVQDYEAVILGGALYAMRWHRDARHFVRRHARQLAQRPTWFFSSGPLDDSATRKDIPPVRGVARLMARVGARGHATFGGRLLPEAKGFPAGAMAKNHAGDWRDPEQVATWVSGIAAELRGRSIPGAA